ncbi:MAG: tetratricopeptide repeat protein [Deltaproteobacteria bacterium]|nr:tetratricopeptide repeat protein [Deltaproteobacteria bacterium]
MNIRKAKNFFLITIIFSVLFFSIADSANASIMEPEKLPIQGEIVIHSEKDIPRLEWIAGKYLQKGRFQDSADLCKKILTYNGNSLKAMAYLAAAYKGLGEEKNFKNQSAAFKKQHPEFTDLYLALAWTYSALEDFKKAEAICKQGIKIINDSNDLIMELASLLLKQGKTGEAGIYYNSILKKKNIPTKIFLNANFSLCRIRLEQKKFDAVIKQAGILTDLYPPIPQSYKFLADAYMGKKEYEKAVNTYKRLMSANPKSELPFQEMALIYNDRLKDKGQALFYAQKGVEKFPGNPKTMDILGWILYINQQYSKALHQFQAAVKISDKNPWFYYHAGMAYQKMEKKSKAIENYEKALDLLKGRPATNFKKQIKKLIVQCR